MAKHTSRKKYNKNTESTGVSKAQADQIISAAAEYIAQWTQLELKNLIDNKKLPVCWPLECGGYRIGNDKLKEEAGIWQRYDRNDEKKQIFPDHQSAIFYSLCQQMGYITTAMKLSRLSRDIVKLRNDIKTYENCIKRAMTAKDDFNITLYRSRHQHSAMKLYSSEDQLRKTIKSAKYIKLWEH
jgi:hypothetical protein